MVFWREFDSRASKLGRTLRRTGRPGGWTMWRLHNRSVAFQGQPTSVRMVIPVDLPCLTRLRGFYKFCPSLLSLYRVRKPSIRPIDFREDIKTHLDRFPELFTIQSATRSYMDCVWCHRPHDEDVEKSACDCWKEKQLLMFVVG
jgi:hypothetical protein